MIAIPVTIMRSNTAHTSPFLFTLTLILTSSLDIVLVVVMRPKDIKISKICSHADSLILSPSVYMVYRKNTERSCIYIGSVSCWLPYQLLIGVQLVPSL